jgi:alpha-acetolactate decarboxylase
MVIHSKETKHTTHEKAARTSHENSISHNISQNSTSATKRIQGTINRIQDAEHRKTNKTQKKLLRAKLTTQI